eukprot:12828570-Ditylum_brightwellii.AAC.1
MIRGGSSFDGVPSLMSEMHIFLYYRFARCVHGMPMHSLYSSFWASKASCLCVCEVDSLDKWVHTRCLSPRMESPMADVSIMCTGDIPEPVTYTYTRSRSWAYTARPRCRSLSCTIR